MTKKLTLDEYRAAAKLRRAARTIKHRQNKKNQGKTCPDCRGVMHWCSACDMWSKSCCQEWGTCQCS